jgi:hypothetical protein
MINRNKVLMSTTGDVKKLLIGFASHLLLPIRQQQ